MSGYLTEILARKRQENLRRRRHTRRMKTDRRPSPARAERAVDALRRVPGASPSVIAEIKFRSPSAGQIRAWSPGEAVRVASAYQEGGASVVSVLADAPGFGGSPLLVRRVADAVTVPVLYKGFVLDSVQVGLAFDMGASLVLLLVRALDDPKLRALMSEVQALGMEPVVEAADAEEVARAVAAGARVVGVNARNLQTFQVDMDAAHRCLDQIPADRVSVFMSGVRSVDQFKEVSAGKADAVLIGEGLMRSEDPGARLEAFLQAV